MQGELKMLLCDLKKGSRINCEVSDGSTFIIFEHIDGMYSYCITEKGEVVHLYAATELEKDGENFKLVLKN